MNTAPQQDNVTPASTKVNTNPLVRRTLNELEEAKKSMAFHATVPRKKIEKEEPSQAISLALGGAFLFICIGWLILTVGGF